MTTTLIAELAKELGAEKTDDSYWTLGPVAKHFGFDLWVIRRLFLRGLLPPAMRIGSYRVIKVSDLPQVEDALRRGGYLPPKEDAA